MKTSTKIVKTLIQFVINVAIAILSFISISSLIILLSQVDLTQFLPKGVEVIFSAYDAWGGVNAFILTFVAGNSLMIYGLLKLKGFVARVTKETVLTEKTAVFLKKGAILMAVVGFIQAITEWVVNPYHIILNFSTAVWLLIASLAVTYLKRYFDKKAA